MNKAEVTPELATMAIFTVCADAELCSLAAQISASTAEVIFAGEFNEYITAGRQLHFPQSMKRGRTSVAIVDFDRDTDAAVETAEALLRIASTRVTCVGVSSSQDSELLLRAMRAGCSEFLQKPISSASLLETVERIQSRAVSMMEASSARGRVLTLAGAKGGVGTSTLAIHLASYLVKRQNRKTLLIDLHYQLGHACLYLGLKKNQYHFDELIRNVDRLDPDLLNGFLVHHACGLSVIGAPDTCAVRQSIAAHDLERVFEFLRHEYDFIVIDSALQDEASMAIIQFSDETYFVSTPDIASLRDLSCHIHNLNLPEAAVARLRVVINRSSPGDAIRTAQVENAIGLRVSMTIPDGGAELLEAVNSGEPLLPQRRSAFTAQIGDWAAQLANHSRIAKGTQAGIPKRKLGFWK